MAHSALRHLSFSTTHIGPLTCRRWTDLFAHYFNYTQDSNIAEFRKYFNDLRDVFTFQHDSNLSKGEKQKRYMLVKEFFQGFAAFAAAAESGLSPRELEGPALMFCMIKNLHQNIEHAKSRGLPARKVALVIKTLRADINRILAEYSETYGLDYVVAVK